MTLLTDVVLPVLEDMDLRYFFAPGYADVVWVLLPLEDYSANMALVMIAGNDDEREIVLQAGICRVPVQRRAVVTQLLDRLTGAWEFARWQLAGTS